MNTERRLEDNGRQQHTTGKQRIGACGAPTVTAHQARTAGTNANNHVPHTHRTTVQPHSKAPPKRIPVDTHRPVTVRAPMHSKGARSEPGAAVSGPFTHSRPSSRTCTVPPGPGEEARTLAGAKATHWSSRGQYMRQPTEKPNRLRSTWGATKPCQPTHKFWVRKAGWGGGPTTHQPKSRKATHATPLKTRQREPGGEGGWTAVYSSHHVRRRRQWTQVTRPRPWTAVRRHQLGLAPCHGPRALPQTRHLQR
jgi:hypothetical protein